MNRTCLIKHKWLPALALFCCLPSLAATVYKTVDSNGVVSFSDNKPKGNAAVDTLVIDAQAPQLSDWEQQRLQAIRETSDRMATDRRAREKHRAELRQLRAQTQAQYQLQQQPPYQADNNPTYFGYAWGYPGYNQYPPRGHWQRRYKPHSQHPIARSPQRPTRQGHRPRRTTRSMATVAPSRHR